MQEAIIMTNDSIDLVDITVKELCSYTPDELRSRYSGVKSTLIICELKELDWTAVIACSPREYAHRAVKLEVLPAWTYAQVINESIYKRFVGIFRAIGVSKSRIPHLLFIPYAAYGGYGSGGKLSELGSKSEYYSWLRFNSSLIPSVALDRQINNWKKQIESYGEHAVLKLDESVHEFDLRINKWEQEVLQGQVTARSVDQLEHLVSCLEIDRKFLEKKTSALGKLRPGIDIIKSSSVGFEPPLPKVVSEEIEERAISLRARVARLGFGPASYGSIKSSLKRFSGKKSRSEFKTVTPYDVVLELRSFISELETIYPVVGERALAEFDVPLNPWLAGSRKS
jgi:hypothetical protein